MFATLLRKEAYSPPMPIGNLIKDMSKEPYWVTTRFKGSGGALRARLGSGGARCSLWALRADSFPWKEEFHDICNHKEDHLDF